MENGHGLIVASAVTEATALSERSRASLLLKQVKRMRGRAGRRLTVGADKAYHEQDFVTAMRGLKIEPHLARCQAS